MYRMRSDGYGFGTVGPMTCGGMGLWGLGDVDSVALGVAMQILTNINPNATLGTLKFMMGNPIWALDPSTIPAAALQAMTTLLSQRTAASASQISAAIASAGDNASVQNLESSFAITPVSVDNSDQSLSLAPITQAPPMSVMYMPQSTDPTALYTQPTVVPTYVMAPVPTSTPSIPIVASPPVGQTVSIPVPTAISSPPAIAATVAAAQPVATPPINIPVSLPPSSTVTIPVPAAPTMPTVDASGNVSNTSATSAPAITSTVATTGGSTPVSMPTVTPSGNVQNTPVTTTPTPSSSTASTNWCFPGDTSSVISPSFPICTYTAIGAAILLLFLVKK